MNQGGTPPSGAPGGQALACPEQSRQNEAGSSGGSWVEKARTGKRKHAGCGGIRREEDEEERGGGAEPVWLATWDYTGSPQHKERHGRPFGGNGYGLGVVPAAGKEDEVARRVAEKGMQVKSTPMKWDVLGVPRKTTGIQVEEMVNAQGHSAKRLEKRGGAVRAGAQFCMHSVAARGPPAGSQGACTSPAEGVRAQAAGPQVPVPQKVPGPRRSRRRSTRRRPPSAGGTPSGRMT